MKGELTTGFGSGSISLRDGAGAMFRRKALVVVTFLTIVLGTLVITFLLPNKYDSRMKILVKNQRVDVAITPEATAGARAFESEVTESQINSEIELLTSRDLLAQVVMNAALPSSSTVCSGRIRRNRNASNRQSLVSPTALSKVRLRFAADRFMNEVQTLYRSVSTGGEAPRGERAQLAVKLSADRKH